MANEEWNSGDASNRYRGDSDIPPVPRVPSIYGRQNAPTGRGRGSRRPDQNRVLFTGHCIGNPLPDPLRSSPTFALSGVVASANYNAAIHPSGADFGSQFPVPNRTSPPVSSASSMALAQSRDTMFVRPPRPIHQPEQTMRSNVGLPHQDDNLNSGVSSSISSRTYGDSSSSSFGVSASTRAHSEIATVESKGPSPKHQRSFFGLRKASVPAIAPNQANDSQNTNHPEESTSQSKKTTNQAMGIDRVTSGAAPPANNPVHDNLTTRDLQPTAKRQRSLFQLRKSPMQNLPPASSSNKQVEVTEQLTSDYPAANSVEDSILKQQGNDKGVPSSSSKHHSSAFNSRKAQTSPSQSQNQDSDQISSSPRQHQSIMNFESTGPTRIPTPVLDNKSRYFSEPVQSSQKKEACNSALFENSS
jgi:hypothetical protein